MTTGGVNEQGAEEGGTDGECCRDEELSTELGTEFGTERGTDEERDASAAARGASEHVVVVALAQRLPPLPLPPLPLAPPVRAPTEQSSPRNKWRSHQRA